MTNDPVEFFEKYKTLFFQHIKDMVKNELDTVPNLSNSIVKFIGQTPVEDDKLSHYSHMTYEVSFQSDVIIHARTIVDIEKWVDVDSCKMSNYNPSMTEYLFEIKILTRRKK